MKKTRKKQVCGAACFIAAEIKLSEDVRPSHLFSLCFHHRIIMKFSTIITNGKSDVHANANAQKSKVKVTEVKTQFSCFRTVTSVWIHSHMATKWCTKLDKAYQRWPIVFKFICQILRSRGIKKIVNFEPNWALPDCNSSLISLMAINWGTKLEVT